MTSDDGRYVLVYNGELYNFRELARELEARGHRSARAPTPRSCCAPTQEWGPACLDRFDGMFAFAVWDDARAEAHARRATGSASSRSTTPRSAVGCCSAPRSRRCSRPACRARVSTDALVEYFTFQNVFSDLTLFDGVRMLPAGHVLVRRRRVGAPERYWDLELEPDESVGEDEWVERLRGGVRVGGRAAARQRRAARQLPLRRDGLGLDRRRRERQDPAPDDVHRRLRPLVRQRPRARLRRARRRRARRERVPHRALRDGDARGRHGLGAARARLAPRGPARRDVATRTTTSRGSRRSS